MNSKAKSKITHNERTSFLFDVLKRYDHYMATTNFKVGLMMSFLATVIIGLTTRILGLLSEISADYLLNAADRRVIEYVMPVR